jgi:hypothetical protein
MARAHEPPNGSDHPPQNGNKGKQVAIALFLATTFGIMAILSFPLSEVGPFPFRIPPLQAALAPAERLIRPIIPWLGPFGPRRAGPAANPPARAGSPPSVPSVPSVPTGPEGPGEGPPPPPPPPGGDRSPTLGTLARPRRPSPPTLTKEMTTLLSTLTKKLTTREARVVRAELAWIRPMRGECLADRACAKQLKKLEKLLRKYEAHRRGRHGGKHRHTPGNESTEGRSRSPGTSDDHGKTSRASGKQGKPKKHGKRHQGLSKGSNASRRG